MKFKMCLLWIIILLILTGCTHQQKSTSCADSIELDQSQVNHSLQLEVLANLNNFKIGSPLFITANNLSQSRIIVVPDDDLKFFVLQGDLWVAVKNKADYLGAVQSISTKSDSELGSRTYSAKLDLSKQSESLQVCIVLEGKLQDNRSNSRVAAFTQVTLNP